MMALPTVTTANPYPGLRPFERADAAFFFGRQEQTAELLSRIQTNRFVGIIGLSGGGKSSVVRAGLIPALEQGYLPDSGSRWRIALMRPGLQPLIALAEALDGCLGPAPGANRIDSLGASSYGLIHATRPGRRPDENLLIVVDQFEELFRLTRRQDARLEEAAHFVQLLLTATEECEPEFRIFVVLTLRADYVGECAIFRPLPAALNRSPYLLPRMTSAQLRESIEGPAALTGMGISPGLLERLLGDVGDDPDQLPVLQHLLMRMWSKCHATTANALLGREHYDSVGGWDNALNDHAEEVWRNLAERQDLAKRMFQRLTERAPEGRDVRRPAAVQELASLAETATDPVIAVVEQCRGEGCSFLTSPSSRLTEQSLIDISHESLIRRWKRLQGWMDEEADWGAWYRRVEDRKRLDGAHFVDPELDLALQAQAHGHWNQTWAERYASEDIAFRDVIDFLEESRTARDSGLDAYFAQVISRLIPEAELKHLSNLYAGNTNGYEGRGALQAELRHLAASGLLVRRPGRTIGEMKRGTRFDLADCVELTDLARFLIKSVEQQRSDALASAVPRAERYLGPIDLREAESIAAEIRKMFETAKTPPTLRSVEPYLRNQNVAHRVVGYLACQVTAQRDEISNWAVELARCLGEERDEASKNRETRPLWQLLVCITSLLRSPSLSERDRTVISEQLQETQKFLRDNPHLDPGGQCKWRIGELLP